MDVQKNQRSQISVDSLVVKIKQENGFKLNNAAVDAVVGYLDSNFMKGKFDEASMPEMHKVTKMEGKKKVTTEFNLRKMEVFKLGEDSYSVADLFTQFTYNNKPIVGSKKEGVTRILNEWIDKTCVEYQNDHLEEKSTEFRDIYQEYKEGILTFNRMQQLVWDRANNDTVGLKEYFAQHQSEYNWNNRFDVGVYFCNDAKMMKTVAKQVKKGISADSLRREHTKKNILDFSYRAGKFELSDTFLFSPSPILNQLFADLSAAKPKYNKPGIYQVGQVGDLLLHVLFYAKIGTEQGHFTLQDSIEAISKKLIHRHPHIYGDVNVQDEEEVKRNWEQLKLQEGKTSLLAGVPNSLPAMVKAFRIQQKVKQVGFEWEHVEQVWDKVEEEIAELKAEIAANNKAQMEAEFGDVLFSLINYARFLNIDPETALEKTNKKFKHRFELMEAHAKANGLDLAILSLSEKEELWQSMKSK